MGQSAASHGDDDGVVAGQQDVDPHDLEEGDPECGLAHLAPAARDHSEPRRRIRYLSHLANFPLAFPADGWMLRPTRVPTQSTGRTRALTSTYNAFPKAETPYSPLC